MYDGDIPNKHIERGEKFLIRLALRNAVQVPSNTVIVRLVFADDANNGTTNWTLRTGWGLTNLSENSNRRLSQQIGQNESSPALMDSVRRAGFFVSSYGR